MKKIVLILAVFLFSGSCAESTIIPQNTDNCVYDFPVKPGTPEWKEVWDKLESYEAMVGICQIPDSILQCIATGNLMELCLQYPFLFDVFAFNDIKDGLKSLFVNFNGIKEFSKREDAINNLREKYLSDIRNFPDKLDNDSTVWRSKIQISALEFLLSYSEFHYNISKEEQKKILENLLFGYREKIKYSEHFQGFGFDTNLFARAHIIIKIDPSLSKIFENTAILFSGMTTDAELINTIDSLSYELIK
jgi:hypothetical protein